MTHRTGVAILPPRDQPRHRGSPHRHADDAIAGNSRRSPRFCCRVRSGQRCNARPLLGCRPGTPPPAAADGVGAFDPTTATWHLRTRAGDPTVFTFGAPGTHP